MGVQFFGGKFYKCVNDEGERLDPEVGYCGEYFFYVSQSWDHFENIFMIFRKWKIKRNVWRKIIRGLIQKFRSIMWELVTWRCFKW